MTVCKGCGVELQENNPSAIGYRKKSDDAYCQRCFRLMHYGEDILSSKTDQQSQQVLDWIKENDVLVVWTVDVFDIESAFYAGLAKALQGKDVLFVGTKRDLLPADLSNEKLARFLFSRLKEQTISVRHLLFTGKGQFENIDALKAKVAKLRNGRSVAVIGKANAGKSTLLNKLSKNTDLTVSRYPGTTLGFLSLTIDSVPYIDTPGLTNNNDLSLLLDSRLLRYITPTQTIKPTVFQIHENQSYFVGGLVRLDVYCSSKATVTWYLPSSIYLHRTSLTRADEVFQKNYGTLLVPTLDTMPFVHRRFALNENKNDIVIPNLGWACLSKNISHIEIQVSQKVDTIVRKAMI